MIELLHDFHLTFDRLPSVRFHQLGLFIDLDSDFLVEAPVKAEADDGVSTLANSLTNKVVV